MPSRNEGLIMQDEEHYEPGRQWLPVQRPSQAAELGHCRLIDSEQTLGRNRQTRQRGRKAEEQ